MQCRAGAGDQLGAHVSASAAPDSRQGTRRESGMSVPKIEVSVAGCGVSLVEVGVSMPQGESSVAGAHPPSSGDGHTPHGHMAMQWSCPRTQNFTDLRQKEWRDGVDYNLHGCSDDSVKLWVSTGYQFTDITGMNPWVLASWTLCCRRGGHSRRSEGARSYTSHKCGCMHPMHVSIQASDPETCVFEVMHPHTHHVPNMVDDVRHLPLLPSLQAGPDGSHVSASVGGERGHVNAWGVMHVNACGAMHAWHVPLLHADGVVAIYAATTACCTFGERFAAWEETWLAAALSPHA